MTQNPIDQRVREIGRAFPSWHIWYVPRAVGGTTWHAQRWDDSGARIDAHSADGLEKLLEAEAEK